MNFHGNQMNTEERKRLVTPFPFAFTSLGVVHIQHTQVVRCKNDHNTRTGDMGTAAIFLGYRVCLYVSYKQKSASFYPSLDAQSERSAPLAHLY